MEKQMLVQEDRFHCALHLGCMRWSCLAISREVLSLASWGWEKQRHALELSGVV